MSELIVVADSGTHAQIRGVPVRMNEFRMSMH